MKGTTSSFLARETSGFCEGETVGEVKTPIYLVKRRQVDYLEHGSMGDSECGERERVFSSRLQQERAILGEIWGRKRMGEKASFHVAGSKNITTMESWKVVEEKERDREYGPQSEKGFGELSGRKENTICIKEVTKKPWRF